MTQLQLNKIKNKFQFVNRTLDGQGLNPEASRLTLSKVFEVAKRSGSWESNIYWISYVRSTRQALQNLRADPLKTPIRDRVRLLRSDGPMAVLGRLKKNEKGMLVSFELEAQLSPTPEIRDYQWPMTAGRVHAEHSGLELPVTCHWSDLTPLRRACKALRAFGAKITTQYGGHVHLDCRDFALPNGKPSKALVGRVNRWLTPAVCFVLKWAVPPSRLNNQYCALLPAIWGHSRRRSYDRFRAVNALSFAKHRTIEIRLGAASLNSHKWEMWARACHWLLRGPIDRARMRELSSVVSPLDAADWISKTTMPPAVKMWLLSRIKKFHPDAFGSTDFSAYGEE